MNLVERARVFINTGSESQADLLHDCMVDGSLDALCAVQLLFEDMYGGATFNFTLKAQAGYCLIRWGNQGLQAMVEGARRTPSSKNTSITLETLSLLAAGQRRTSGAEFAEPRLVDDVEKLVPDWSEVTASAKALLIRVLLEFASDDEAIFAVGHQFSKHTLHRDGARQLFEAAAVRLIAVNEATIRSFEDHLVNNSSDEPAFQEFLTQHPQMLDPMAVEIWPQPSLWGAKEPDFVIRRADDTYVVVEIECPGKLLLTSTGQLSADTSHAVHQVLDYADNLVRRHEAIAHVFDRFRAPDCLVVNGLEGPLDREQKRMLVLENAHRRGVRIVGFDWLATRARATASNFVGHHVRISTARLT